MAGVPTSTQNVQSSATGPASANSQQSQPQQSAMDVDPIAKFQMLLPTLKNSLVNLMKISSQVLQQNGFTDCGKGKPADFQSPQQRFEKSLEEFYSICDQIEVNLRLALETHSQITDSIKNTPVTLPTQKVDPVTGQEAQTSLYQQYLCIVKAQVNCAKELQNLLADCGRKLGET